MIGWADFEVTLEQHRDRLRRAEKTQIVRQLATQRQRPTLSESTKRLVQGTLKPGTVKNGMETGRPAGFSKDSI